MPKKKTQGSALDGVQLKELLIKYGIDPAEEILKMVVETYPYPDTGDPDKDREIMESLRQSYELYQDERGSIRLRPKLQIRMQAMQDLNSYVNPKLRGMEIRGNVDHTFNISIQTFDNYGPTNVVDITQPKAQLNEPNREGSQSVPDGTVNGPVP